MPTSTSSRSISCRTSRNKSVYGSLPQWSVETRDQAHRANLKDGWNASNHNLNYLPQVFAFQRRVLCFEIRS